MFGTLHCKSHTKEAEFIERPHGSLDPEKTSACDRCRAKKVRCNTTYGECSRCKHLGKTCTFSAKGDQRKRKACSNIARRQDSQDFATQPSSSSSSKTRGQEERVYSDRRPFTPSLTTDGNIDENERGRQLLARPLPDKLGDSPRDFLAEFDQQTSNHDGDNNILNLSFSPSPFFSTILPGSHPSELIHPSSAKTSDSFLTPPLSTGGDEIPWYFPPTKQCQASRAFSYQLPPPSGQQQQCECLAAVIFAVEELEASCNSATRSDLDSIVANEKEAVKACRSMLNCGNCIARRENLVLLVFMAEKLVAACSRIVALYRAKKNGDNNNTTRASSSPLRLNYPSTPLDNQERNPPPSSKPPSNHSTSTSITSLSTSTATPPNHRSPLLNDYEVSSPQEWEHVVRVLIFLQLAEVLELLADMKKVGGDALGETQMAGLVRAEVRAGGCRRDVCAV